MTLQDLITAVDDGARMARRGCGPTWFQRDIGPILAESARQLRVLRALQSQAQENRKDVS